MTSTASYKGKGKSRSRRSQGFMGRLDTFDGASEEALHAELKARSPYANEQLDVHVVVEWPEAAEEEAVVAARHNQ